MGKNTQRQETGSSNVLREFSSGGIVSKNGLWLIKKTSASKLYPKSYWMLPKGWIDDSPGDKPGAMASGLIKADETSLQNAALREVREETGVDAKIIKKIGTSFYSYTDPNRGKILKFVTFYLMEFVKELPEGFDWETSEIAWLPFNEAKKQLSFGGEKEMLVKAQELLKSS